MSSNQCPSMMTLDKGKRVRTTVFCTEKKGHEGLHRGWRAQWNDKGEKVPFDKTKEKKT